MRHPANKVLGGFTSGQRYNTAGVVLHPFDKAHGCELSQRGKVVYDNRSHLFFWSIQVSKRGLFERVSFNGS